MGLRQEVIAAMTPETGKVLMIAGGAVFLAGAAAKLGLLSWFGHLPGDIAVKKEGFSFYFPVVTCVVVSALLTLVLQFFRKP